MRQEGGDSHIEGSMPEDRVVGWHSSQKVAANSNTEDMLVDSIRQVEVVPGDMAGTKEFELELSCCSWS